MINDYIAVVNHSFDFQVFRAFQLQLQSDYAYGVFFSFITFRTYAEIIKRNLN